MINKLINIFETANCRFIERDISLVFDNVNERALCGALAQHLSTEIFNTQLKNYYVDVEYNRNQGKVKTIIREKSEVVTINCDIILHSRGEIIEKDNLIAIEMKKSASSRNDKQNDRNRLIALTKGSYDDVWSFDGLALPEHVCGYELGIYYEVNKQSREIYLEYYSKGKLISNKKLELMDRRLSG